MTTETYSAQQQETPGGRSSLGHLPGQRWEFDDAVTDVFDDMLRRSIPQLDSMREVVHRFARRLIQPGTDVVDLGCARGDGIASLLAGNERANRFIGVEVSEPMLQAARQRFRDAAGINPVDIQHLDLRVSYPQVRASLTLCILTLQFIPVEHRFKVLAEARERTVPGGGLILVEKILGETPRINALLSEQYCLHKRAMGYTQKEVDAKRAALEGVLVPLTASWNEQLLRTSGFRDVECIWRCMNFCGWVAIA
jgi:tRNA (cmo5U34)-methyltransferase